MVAVVQWVSSKFWADGEKLGKFVIAGTTLVICRREAEGERITVKEVTLGWIPSYKKKKNQLIW